MSLRSKQICSLLLGASGAYVGIWALFFPQAFYDSFPGLGHHWVETMGPFNEHLIRDVGGMYTAMAIMSMLAALKLHRESLALIGVGWLTFNTAHFLFHADHLEMYGTADQIGNVVLLGGVLVLALVLVLPEGLFRGFATANRTQSSS